MIATIKTLPHYFPHIFVERVILSALIIVALCVLWSVLFIRKKIRIKQFVALLVLSFYVVFVYYYTVIGRYSSEMYRNQIYLSYSYSRLLVDFNISSIIIQITLNIVMLIPVGFLCPIVFEPARRKYLRTLIIASAITLSIELLQVVLACGTFEVEDIVNNLLGAGIGMLLHRIIFGKAGSHGKSKQKR